MAELELEEIKNILVARSLTYVMIGDHLIVMRSEFDVIIVGEPYIAFMLILNLKSGVCMTRVWNRTIKSWKVVNITELELACRNLFDEGKPCVGYPDNNEEGKECILLPTVIPRKISKACLNRIGKEGNSKQDSCSECLKLKVSRPKNGRSEPMEEDPLKQEPLSKSSDKFTCSTCGTHFPKKAYLESHMKYSKCNNELSNVKMQQGNLKFKCPECPVICHNEYNLKSHMAVHPTKHACPNCGLRLIEKHMRIHKCRGTSEYKPPITKDQEKIVNSASTPSATEREETNFVDYRDFPCELCGRSFCQEDLKIHVREHGVEKCDHCMFVGNDLDKHMKHMHTCWTCGKVFKETEELFNHTTRYHLLMKGIGEEQARKELETQFSQDKVSELLKRRRGIFDLVEPPSAPEREETDLENNGDFPCDVCGRMFSHKDLLVHMRDHGAKKCVHCKFVGKDLDKHLNHMHTCWTCGKLFKGTPKLFNHTRQHLLNRGLNEEQARKELETQFSPAKLSHLLRKRGGIFFTCEICGKLTPSFRRLNQHKKESHKDPNLPATCSKCGKEFENLVKMREHRSKDHPNEKFPCEHCGVHLTLSGLRDHLRRHQDPQFKCSICDLKFKTTIVRRAHEIREHSTDEKFNCKYCGLRCESMAALRKHTMTHEDPKFKCSYCHKMLKTKNTLATHEREHTGERPFHCDVCGKGFKSGCVLYTHRTHVHKIVRPGTNPKFERRIRNRKKAD